MVTAPPRLSEAAWQSRVVDYATWRKWLVFHVRDARKLHDAMEIIASLYRELARAGSAVVPQPATTAAPLLDALRLIDRSGCETFTRGRCLDPGSGRIRGSDYGADSWCDPCIARDALNRWADQLAGSAVPAVPPDRQTLADRMRAAWHWPGQEEFPDEHASERWCNAADVALGLLASAAVPDPPSAPDEEEAIFIGFLSLPKEIQDAAMELGSGVDTTTSPEEK